MTVPFYPPGSDEARELGCTCPRMDNDYGKGIPHATDGCAETKWYISSECPLHGDAIRDAD